MSASDAIESRPATKPVVTQAGPVAAGPRARRRRRESRIVQVLPPVVVGLLMLGFWQLLTATGAVREYLLPAPADVARAFQRGVESGDFWSYGRTTLQESLSGFALGVGIAVPLGYGIARSRLLARAVEPFVAASQALPAVAIAPLLVLWLGYGLKAIAVLCALIVFFPMVVNTAVGIRTLDRDTLDAARVDGAGFWPLLLYFELPLALPVILAGVRTALTLSITGAVVGEFVIGDRGLGGLMTIARGNFDTPLAFATILMLMVLASIMYGIAWALERLAARKFQE
jgi:NitT/TauT family transport system permease protein